MLAAFLDNVASRRPKTEQKKMREAQMAAANAAQNAGMFHVIKLPRSPYISHL